MFRNYLKLALRNLIRNRVQSIIQILSLTIGLTVFSLISLYVYDEITIDRNNPGFETVYRIEQPESTRSKDVLRLSMGLLFKEKLPEIQSMAMISPGSTLLLTYLEESGRASKQVTLQNFIHVDSGFQDIFPQEYLLGDQHTSLKDPYSIVLTESTSKKLFGYENPVGKILNNNLTITGVIKDPLNTHLKFEAIQSLERILQNKNINKDDLYSIYKIYKFDVIKCVTYIRIHQNSDTKELEQKMSDAWMEFSELNNISSNTEKEFFLNPLKKVHFSDIEPWSSYMTRVDKGVLAGIFGLGLNLLLLGIINYVNLTTARASRRRKEVAIKRIVGSTRSKLIFYFLTESVLTVFISFLFAATFMQLLFPWFNNLLQADINLYFLAMPRIWVLILLSVLAIGLISGIYPSIRMSKGPALIALSENDGKNNKELLIRRVLMMMQFTVAVILMIVILSMHLQVRYMKNNRLGFLEDKIVWINTEGIIPTESRSQIIPRMLNVPGIESACLTEKVPGAIKHNNSKLNWSGHTLNGYDIEWFWATHEFFNVYGVKLTHGQETLDFLDHIPAKTERTDTIDRAIFMINETCRKILELDDPVGTPITESHNFSGAFEDFHFQSLRYQVEPLVIVINNNLKNTRHLSLKIRGDNLQKTLRQAGKELEKMRLKNTINQGATSIPLKFEYLDDTFNRLYEQEERIHSASLYISVLSLIIACLGLFGLSTFMAQRRTKEIGIRKTMGSSTKQVFMLLATDFIKWVSISILIGLPVGHLVMNKWQEQFAYKADIGIWVYLVTTLIAFGIAFLTVTWQSIKTAITNPVDSLRYE